jgi:transcriptional regulator with XRE-family HTH domain
MTIGQGTATPLGRPLQLRTERQRRGWSLLDVASRTHIDTASLSQVERGVRPAYAGWRQRIACAFGLAEEELFRVADEPPAAAANQPTSAPPDEAA